MKIKMLKLAAGPNGVKEIGRCYEVEDAEGQALLEADACVTVDEPTVRATPAAEEVAGDASIDAAVDAKPKKAKKAK